MDYSGLGAALQSFGGFMTDRAERKEYEKKEKDRLEAAKKAQEEAERKRVERRQLYLKQPDYSYGPPQLAKPTWYEMGTNAQGEVVQDIPANAAQLFNIEQEQIAAAQTTAAAKSEAEAKMRDEDRKERDLDSKIKYRAAATSAANRSNLAEPGGSTRGRSEADLSKTVVNLMGDPDYMAAVNAGDPRVMQRMGAPDKIVDAMKSVATGLGVSLPEDTRTTIERDLQKETTPEGRAKIWEIFLREMDIAAAKGRASGKGIRAPREQSN